MISRVLRGHSTKPYSLDDLFGKYHHYLRDNQAYKTMHRTLYDAAADVLAARTDNDELVFCY